MFSASSQQQKCRSKKVPISWKRLPENSVVNQFQTILCLSSGSKTLPWIPSVNYSSKCDQINNEFCSCNNSLLIQPWCTNSDVIPCGDRNSSFTITFSRTKQQQEVLHVCKGNPAPSSLVCLGPNADTLFTCCMRACLDICNSCFLVTKLFGNHRATPTYCLLPVSDRREIVGCEQH